MLDTLRNGCRQSKGKNGDLKNMLQVVSMSCFGFFQGNNDGRNRESTTHYWVDWTSFHMDTSASHDTCRSTREAWEEQAILGYSDLEDVRDMRSR